MVVVATAATSTATVAVATTTPAIVVVVVEVKVVFAISMVDALRSGWSSRGSLKFWWRSSSYKQCCL
jgi:hypothetical protein